MADRYTVSVPDDRSDIMDWVDEQVEKGRFSSRSHAVWYALEELRDGGVEEVVV